MTALLPAFPDTEATMLALLAPVVGASSKIGTVTPATLTPPFVLVQRIGGDDNGITDFPMVAVTCFGGSRAEAWQMAESCRQLILAASNESPGGTLIDFTRTVTPSQQLPDPNTNLRVVTATYRLGLRRPRTS